MKVEAPNIDPKKAEEFLNGICKGTTSKPSDFRIHFLGAYVALIGVKGTTYSDNGGTNYCQSHIDIYYLQEGDSSSRLKTKELHEGRYSQKKLESLIKIAQLEEAEAPARIAEAQAARAAAKNLTQSAITFCDDKLKDLKDKMAPFASKIKIEPACECWAGGAKSYVQGSISMTFKNGIQAALTVDPDNYRSLRVDMPKDKPPLELLDFLAKIDFK